MVTKEGLREQWKFPFSDQITDTLNFAEEEAKGLRHNYIGTEHLLLGLCKNESPVLKSLGIEIEKVRRSVEFIIGRGDIPVRADSIGYTPRAKRVIELSIDEARRTSSSALVDDHLLLGLVREGEGIAVGVLEGIGVNLNEIRRVGMNGLDAYKVIRPALSSLSRLQMFLEDPDQDLVRKQQLKMILDGAVGLILPTDSK